MMQLDISERFSFATMIIAIGSPITIIPYLMGLGIIKESDSYEIWKYTISGICTPIFSYIILLRNVNSISELNYILMIAITGAICGTIYGIIDNKIPSTPEKRK